MKSLQSSLLFLILFQIIFTQDDFFGESNTMILDTKNPSVELTIDDFQTEYLPGSTVTINWIATDDSFGGRPIEIFIPISFR